MDNAAEPGRSLRQGSAFPNSYNFFMLYTCYIQYNRMDTEEIKAGFDELYRHMNGIPLRDMDGIIDTVCTLCREHEKAGFVEGVKVGMRLKQELSL